MELIKELIDFLKSRKKIWLFPVIMFLMVVGWLLIAAQGSVLSPFIYTLF